MGKLEFVRGVAKSRARLSGNHDERRNDTTQNRAEIFGCILQQVGELAGIALDDEDDDWIPMIPLPPRRHGAETG